MNDRIVIVGGGFAGFWPPSRRAAAAATTWKSPWCHPRPVLSDRPRLYEAHRDARRPISSPCSSA